MTTVNWERLPGESVEELAAALILRGRSEGNRVTPSRGDRGIDLRVWNGRAWEIYQIKRYCRPLTAKQARDVEGSWSTFLAHTLPVLNVSAWHLVMPWDPTNERLEWLAAVTAESDVQTDWIGRNQLDYLAAGNPQLVAYFHGDGAAQVQHLLASALRAGSPPPSEAGGDALLNAVVERQTALASSLDEVDPFYRYELEVRPGPLPDTWATNSLEPDGAALIVYQQASDDQHTVMRILPRDELAPLIRPITQTINFDISDPKHGPMVEAFARYGAPIDRVPAVTLQSQGPPGATVPIGSTALISFVVAQQHDGIPDLEVRLRDADQQIVCVLPLSPADVSTGFDGSGMRIEAWDTSRTLRAEFRLSRRSGVPSELSIQTSSISGKPVRRVLGVAEFVAAAKHGCTIELAIVGGLPVSAGWQAGEFPIENWEGWAEIIRDLVEIQAHTHAVVRVPQTLSAADAKEIKYIARLLRGEVLPFEPDRVRLTLTPDAEVDSSPIAVLFHRAIEFKLDGRSIPVDRYVRVYSPQARIELGSRGKDGGREGYVVFDTAGIAQAIEPPTT